MNYLQLIQRLKQECAIQGDPPTSSVGLTGIFRKLADWVSTAYVEIENGSNWNWMYRTATLAVPAGNRNVVTAGVTPKIQALDPKLAYIYADANFKYPVQIRDYRELLARFDTGAVLNGMPRNLAINPLDGSFYLDAVPDQPYNLLLGYWREVSYLKSTPEAATDDAAVPGLPTRYHMLIVYRAMMYYGEHEGAMDVYQYGRQMYESLHTDLQAEQLPQIAFSTVRML